MTRIMRAHTLKRIARSAIFGAIGFGTGGAICGPLVAFEEPRVGFAVLGAAGGMSMGLALDGWRKTWILVLACAIGFGAGFMTAFLIVLAIWSPPRHAEGLFIGAVGGAIGGVSLGLASRNWGRAGLLSLAGAVGFGIAAQFDWYLLQVLRVSDVTVLGFAVKLAIWGIVGGALLGAALGYLEKEEPID